MMRAWITAQRARAKLTRRPVDRLEIVRSYAAGKSFLDVGCMWSVHGEVAFAAVEAGAGPVTGVDVMPASPEFEARNGDGRVRFVQGDLHDEAVLAEAGPHDVVWCSGVLYHAPNPVATLEALRSVCGETLLLATEILPDVPGVPGACVLYPALSDSERRAYARVPGGDAIGVTTPYDPGAGFGNWFWGITPSALDGLLRVAGFGPVERSWRPSPFHITVAASPR